MGECASTRAGSAARSLGAWKWWICGILFAATVLNYLDRQTMAICAPMISDEFDLTDEDFGRLLSAFRWTYAFAQIPAGFLADRFSVRIVYALAVGFWSLAGAAAGVVLTPRALGWTRRALGLGESFNWPCALRVTANMLPPEDRGLGNGIFVSGSAVGAMTAPLIIGPVAVAFGWRAAFVAIGLLGGLWILVWLAATGGRRKVTAPATPDAATAASASTAKDRWSARLRRVFLNPGFWLLAIISSLVNPCWYFLADWLPKYMHDQRDFGLLAAGMVTIPIFVGADLGNIGGGALVKFLVSRSWSVRGARALTVTLGSMLSMSAILAAYVDSAYVCIVLVGVSALGIQAFLANYLVCVQDVSFTEVGLVAGVLGVFGNVVGATVNPFIGRYVDTHGNYNLIFVLLGVLPLVSLGAILLFDWLNARRQGRDTARPSASSEA